MARCTIESDDAPDSPGWTIPESPKGRYERGDVVQATKDGVTVDVVLVRREGGIAPDVAPGRRLSQDTPYTHYTANRKR